MSISVNDNIHEVLRLIKISIFLAYTDQPPLKTAVKYRIKLKTLQSRLMSYKAKKNSMCVHMHLQAYMTTTVSYLYAQQF